MAKEGNNTVSMEEFLALKEKCSTVVKEHFDAVTRVNELTDLNERYLRIIEKLLEKK